MRKFHSIYVIAVTWEKTLAMDEGLCEAQLNDLALAYKTEHR